MYTYNIRHLLVLAILICLFATSAYAAQISVEPVYQEVFQGENVTINITVYPEGSGVYSASYTLYFNNTLLYATSQTPGPFLTQDGNSSNVWKRDIDNAIGRIEYAEGRVGTDVGVNDSGVLTTIVFQAIGDKGTSPLNISDLDGGILYSTTVPIPAIINNGSIKINETPGFTISGFVEYGNGDPVPDPDVMITNLNTSEVFVAETNASSNHYQVSINFTHINSSDVLRFNATDDLGNATVFNHTVTPDEMNAGGFVQNITIPITSSQHICGDVNGDDAVNMADVTTLWYDIADYPTPGAYTISNAWAADVNCDGQIDMADVMTLWYDIADYPMPGAYAVNCCPICGDVNGDDAVNMADVTTLWYDIADYPYLGAYTISNAWAADVNCDGQIDMVDVMTLWYDIADYPTLGAYEVECCD
jgi:hypothetical protein